jgi:hypothetical protein
LDVFGAAAEVQEQDVTTLDRPLDTGNQRQSAFGRVRCQRRHVELMLVQRNRQRTVTQFCRTVDQLDSCMGNADRPGRLLCGREARLSASALLRLLLDRRSAVHVRTQRRSGIVTEPSFS